MAYLDQPYLNIIKDILQNGIQSDDRTGIGTRGLFAQQMRFDLTKGFPLLTSKRVKFELIVSELLWFLNGDTNIKYLLENDNHIWDEWAFERWVKHPSYAQLGENEKAFQELTNIHGLNYQYENPEFKAQYRNSMNEFLYKMRIDEKFAKQFGELGPVYGRQWRAFNQTTTTPGIDQIENLIKDLQTKPESRRHIVSAWNPNQIEGMALPPCHTLFQMYVRNGTLSCHLHQRSGDMFLGVPFNIASYALLTHIIAKQTGLDVGELSILIGDAHIYNNHFDQIHKQLNRDMVESPTLECFEKKPLDQYTVDDFNLENYNPHKGIKAPIAI